MCLWRLSKRIAHGSRWSRRQALDLIRKGKISVDGSITEDNIMVGPSSIVTLEGGTVIRALTEPRLFRYFKPDGVLVTNHDPAGRPTVFDPGYIPQVEDISRLIAVGRLDFNTEGLLLLSTCGETARYLERPSSGIERIYVAWVSGVLDGEVMKALASGAVIEGVRYRPINIEQDTASASASHKRWVRVSLAEGKNREVRKALAAAGVKVMRLVRLSYGPYDLDGLEPNELDEVAITAELKRAVTEQKALDSDKQRPGDDAGGTQAPSNDAPKRIVMD
mmetsp:Transcript_25293/g.47203  ORF Transcript_25293/g.47203 Transcript_25293/m.47203 type:complete len:278 (-) Transcript_25293:184-1017(-)